MMSDGYSPSALWQVGWQAPQGEFPIPYYQPSWITYSPLSSFQYNNTNFSPSSIDIDSDLSRQIRALQLSAMKEWSLMPPLTYQQPIIETSARSLFAQPGDTESLGMISDGEEWLASPAFSTTSSPFHPLASPVKAISTLTFPDSQRCVRKVDELNESDLPIATVPTDTNQWTVESSDQPISYPTFLGRSLTQSEKALISQIVNERLQHLHAQRESAETISDIFSYVSDIEGRIEGLTNTIDDLMAREGLTVDYIDEMSLANALKLSEMSQEIGQLQNWIARRMREESDLSFAAHITPATAMTDTRDVERERLSQPSESIASVLSELSANTRVSSIPLSFLSPRGYPQSQTTEQERMEQNNTLLPSYHSTMPAYDTLSRASQDYYYSPDDFGIRPTSLPAQDSINSIMAELSATPVLWSENPLRLDHTLNLSPPPCYSSLGGSEQTSPVYPPNRHPTILNPGQRPRRIP